MLITNNTYYTRFSKTSIKFVSITQVVARSKKMYDWKQLYTFLFELTVHECALIIIHDF